MPRAELNAFAQLKGLEPSKFRTIKSLISVLEQLIESSASRKRSPKKKHVILMS